MNNNGNLPNAFPGAPNLNLNIQVNQNVPTGTSTTSVPYIGYKFQKAGTNGNLIAVLLDESGSMNSCRHATIAGFNEFVLGQKSVSNAGAAYLTLNKFDSPKITTVYADRIISEVPELTTSTYTPNGGTNLYDGIGYTIEQVNNALAKIPEDSRPGVTIVITTDGQENSSNKFTSAKIKEMVAATEEAGWSYLFLAANLDSFAVGSAFGMNAMNSVNYSTSKMGATMTALNSTVTKMRVAKTAGLGTEAVYASAMFTDQERNDIV
jgi:hypothetical protein